MSATTPGTAAPAGPHRDGEEVPWDLLGFDDDAPAETTTEATTVVPADEPEQEADEADAPRRPGRGRRFLAHLRAAIGQSKLMTRHPIALADAWRRSDVIDPRRIPDESDFWALMWLISNRVDRIIWFGIYLIAPTFLAGGVLYVAERPTRRWGTVIVLVLVLALIPAMLA